MPIENTLWLELLLPFPAVTNLYSSEEFAPGIATALQELVGGQNKRSIAQLAEYFRGGAQAKGAVQCRATAVRSPFYHF
jgi:hypothetical protein